MSALHWQKSSYSSESVNCVYLAAAADGGVRIRESDEPEVVITTSGDGLRAFLRGVKAGAFDHLTS
ncbi:DUF397 domain-containing protein [Streptomyces sp. CBMA123]|nr:DUF397 domain-containing protein [Streptomyces sp. CBMA123]MBD0689740.1 DUF397 domain-containing protein [Streptomyces sp. CBMA123]